MQPYLCDVNDLLKDDLQRIGDLINIEGPLLSLFQHNKTKHFYLFDWIDNNDKCNRWLIYIIKAKVLNSFLKKDISYNEMFSTINRKHIYYADVDSGVLPPDYIIYKLSEIPATYQTDYNIYFQEHDAKGLERILKVLSTYVRVQNPFSKIIEVYDTNKENYIILPYKLAFTDIQNHTQVSAKQQIEFGETVEVNKWTKTKHNPFANFTLKVKENDRKLNRISEFSFLDL